MLFSMHLYDRPYIFSFLFHFILELLSISMVMINIVKFELINTSENRLLNIFSVRIFFLPTKLFLIYPSLLWPRSRGTDIIWTNILYNILGNEWEPKFVYHQNFPLGKKLAVLFFLAKVFPSSFAVNV